MTSMALSVPDSTIHRSSGSPALGRTLPSLLLEACERTPNEQAFVTYDRDDAQALSTREFRRQAEELAVGLRESGFARGDRMVLFCHSDTSFVLADMACLIAGIVTVPVYLTHAPAAIRFILRQTSARGVIASDDELLERFTPHLSAGDALHTVVLARAAEREHGLNLRVLSFDALRERGRTNAREDGNGAGDGDGSQATDEGVRARSSAMIADLDARDLATIIYTSGTTGLPKGVMLSHENISSNAIGAFGEMPELRDNEIALSFLPLTHIFARTLQYGYMLHGVSVHYSDPDRVREDFRRVRPTVFATVPRVLEKAYERILATGAELTGMKRQLFDWALALTREHRVETPPLGTRAMTLRVADRLVLSKWRAALGGRIRYVIVGGAALRADLVNTFGAAGMKVLQGYGLTETSPVITFNRPDRNRPGTVGEPLPGVEVAIGERGEVLTRGPHVMLGYYEDDDATRAAIDDEGWFRTGDQGSLEDGFLTITGRLKSLFKLSTGKFVMPQPLEGRLEAEALFEHALVVGEGERYCAALVFLNEDAARTLTGSAGDDALASPALEERVRELVALANEGLPPWSCIKRVAVTFGELTIENELLTPTLKVRRPRVLERYSGALDALYGRADAAAGTAVLSVRPEDAAADGSGEAPERGT